METTHHPILQEVEGRRALETAATITIPLKGLSGILRRAAYRLPDWKPRRWLILLMADRVDAVESRLTPRTLLLIGGLGGLVAGLRLGSRRRRRHLRVLLPF